MRPKQTGTSKKLCLTLGGALRSTLESCQSLLLVAFLETVRVKDGMSLRHGMWRGSRNAIIMRNVIYAE